MMYVGLCFRRMNYVVAKSIENVESGDLEANNQLELEPLSEDECPDLDDIVQSDGDTISRAPNDHGKLIGHTKEGYAIRIM